MVSSTKYTVLLILPKMKVVSKLPRIWEDIMRPQNSPNSSLLRFSLATALV